jgi:biotin carboxylase
LQSLTKKGRYLIFLPEGEWISLLPLKEVDLSQSTVIVPTNFPCLTAARRIFKDIYEVGNYHDSSYIIAMAAQIYEKAPYDQIIAPDEMDILRAATLRSRFSLAGQSYESALAFHDKIIMKQIIAQSGLKVPSFNQVKCFEEIENFLKYYGYPAVLKPARSTGCHGIVVLKNPQDFEQLRDSKHLFQDEERFLIEGFIDGKVYHVNGLVLESKVSCCWPSVYSQSPLDMVQGLPASSILLSQDNPLTPQLILYAKKILAALPTPAQTAFHLELFITKDSKDPIFCEIASRVGGKGINLSWKTSFGIDLKAIFLRMQFGLSSSLKMPRQPSILSGEVWFPKTAGKLKSLGMDCPFSWVKEYQIYVKPGDLLSDSQNISAVIGGSPLVLGQSEKELESRIEEFSDWFRKSLQYE